MNIFCGMGRLTADPKISTYSGNDGRQGTIARYTLAIDRMGRTDDKATDFISCVTFGKAAEFVQNYLTKGRRVSIVGRIQTGSYTNKDGQRVYTTEVVVNEHHFADNKPQDQQMQNQGYQYQAQTQMMKTSPQMAQAPQGYVDPQNPYQNPTAQQMPPQMPPQMSAQPNYQQAPQMPPQFNPNEGFMQVPQNSDTGLPFN